MSALLVIGGVVALAAALCAFVNYFLSEEESELEKLGVTRTYTAHSVPLSRIEAYEELKDKMRQQHGKDEEEDRVWMSQMPAQAKDAMKYLLMQRAIGGVSVLRKVDADARGYGRLFNKGVVTKTFWDSVKDMEQEVTEELEQVKLEASFLEPKQNPQGIISEAVQFLMRFGDQLPPPSGSADPSAASAAARQALPGAPGPAAAKAPSGPPQGAPGGPPRQMPPGVMPPGVMPPGMRPPHPGMMGPPRGPPPAQKGGEDNGYSWKQDTDELEVAVVVPAEATKAQIKVSFAAKKLRVEHEGKVVVDGQLAAACIPDGSTWTMGKGKVVISLEKADPRPWPSLFAPQS